MSASISDDAPADGKRLIFASPTRNLADAVLLGNMALAEQPGLLVFLRNPCGGAVTHYRRAAA